MGFDDYDNTFGGGGDDIDDEEWAWAVKEAAEAELLRQQEEEKLLQPPEYHVQLLLEQQQQLEQMEQLQLEELQQQHWTGGRGGGCNPSSSRSGSVSVRFVVSPCISLPSVGSALIAHKASTLTVKACLERGRPHLAIQEMQRCVETLHEVLDNVVDSTGALRLAVAEATSELARLEADFGGHPRSRYPYYYYQQQQQQQQQQPPHLDSAIFAAM
jgi:hypothetical protein